MKHNKTWTKVGQENIEIDTSIVHLVEALNDYGIKTLASCEGDDRGYVAIDIDNVDVWIGKVNGKQEIKFSLRFEAPGKPTNGAI
jgi:hypothetical protein